LTTTCFGPYWPSLGCLQENLRSYYIMYYPCNYTTFHNSFKPKPKGPLKSHIVKQNNYYPQSHKFTDFTATPTCYNAKHPHLSPSKITSTIKNLPVGTEVHTAQTCYSKQNWSSRELLLYSARSFIILPKCRTMPQA